MPPPPAAAAARDGDELPLLRGEREVALVLTRLVVSAALTVVLVAVACALFASFGLWRAWLAWPLVAVLAAVSVRWSRPVTARPMPLWVAATLVGLALGSAVWTGVTHTEQVLPRRDAGSYAQSATSLALQHRTPIAIDTAPFGGPDALRIDGVSLQSQAFYQVGSVDDPAVQPQFLIGAPAWYSLARWVGGPTGMLVSPVLFGGLCVLAVGLLSVRVIGARWAPVAAAGVALAYPFVHTVRATYSEPVALLTLLAGLLVLTEGARAGNRGAVAPARALGLLAGVLVGGSALVRVDALRETILLLPVAALLLVRRNPVAGRLLAGAGALTLVSGVTGLALSYRYLGDIAASLVPLVVLGVAMLAGCAAVVWACLRGWRLPARLSTALPALAAAAVGLVAVVLASRPFWQTVRQSAADPGSRVVAVLQQQQGLAVDGGRTYAEQTLVWTAWWVGWPAVVLTFVVVAVCAHRVSRAWRDGAPLPSYAGALVVGFGSAVLVWWRPGITPDHPWADRRLLIIVALVVVCATAAAAWTVRYAARRLPAGVLAAAFVVMPAVVLVPAAVATWPHLTERVEHGEVAAVDTVCAALGPRDVTLTVDDTAQNAWPQVVRGWCGRPSLTLTNPVRRDASRREAAVAELSRLVQGAGHRLVLVSAGSPTPAEGPDGARTATQVLDVTVPQDPSLLERRPSSLVPLRLRVWLAPVG